MPPSKPMLILVSPVSVAPSLPERSDDELMQLARAGKSAAFDTLVQRYQGRVLRTAARFLADMSLAPDAAQRAFVELYRQRDRYKPLGKFWPYLCRIVLNQCRMAGRAERRHRALEVDCAASASEGDDAELLAREQVRRLELALQQLSPKLREVVVMRHVSGLSLEEIGEALSIPVGTVKSRLFSALARLRDALEGEV